MLHWTGANRRGLASSAAGHAVQVFAPAGRSGALHVDCCSMHWCGGIATGVLHIGTWGGCYTMTALRRSTVTQVGSGQVGSEWTLASARALHLPPNVVQVFRTLYGTRVLRFLGCVVQDKYEESRQRDEE